MAHDVFISHHTKSSLSVTQAVCNSLESKGIRCWYAPRDTEGDYASAIYRAIQEARIFILILNKEASYSEDVLNEINLACQRVRDGDELIILPFHISSEDINGAAKYYLARMHWIDAIEPPMQERIAELIKKVLHLLSEGKTPVTEEETPGKTLLQPSRINCGTGFMGRDEELQQLHETLTAYDRVFMYGIGGIGKSELARQYAKKFSDAYDTIVFATYSSSLREMVTNDTDIVISNFRRAAGETEEEYFGRKMARLNRIADERTLVIVDNFDTDSDPDLEAFASGGFRILFTTRNDHSDTGYPIMHIRELDEEEQYTLFLKNYSRPVRGNDEGDIRAILRMVNGHTLTIELIAKLMQISRRPAKILEEIRSSGLASAMRGTVKHEFSSDTAYQYIHRLFSMKQSQSAQAREVSRYCFLRRILGTMWGQK